ncbi:MAG: DUF302 domain-containing protein [Actinobacteria bacterium]|nr:MAG: DUF302 domain-containing protein [Actinomycetota bacterium]
MEYTYRRATSRDFESTVQAVRESVPAHGFELRHVHDLQATLAAKGFPIQPLCIFELWLADEAVTRSRPGRLLMPCRLHVFVEEDAVCVAVIRPTLSALMFPEVDFDGLDGRLEAAMVDIVDVCTAA